MTSGMLMEGKQNTWNLHCMCDSSVDHKYELPCNVFLLKRIGISGLPRHRENREFGCPLFQTGKTQGICQKY